MHANGSSSAPRVVLISYAQGPHYAKNLAELRAASTSMGFASSLLWGDDAEMRADPLVRSRLAKVLEEALRPCQAKCQSWSLHGAFKGRGWPAARRRRAVTPMFRSYCRAPLCPLRARPHHFSNRVRHRFSARDTGPFCAAFKAVLFLRAMVNEQVDYVLWADASRHKVYTGSALSAQNVQAAIRGLREEATAAAARLAGVPAWATRSAYGIADCDCGLRRCAGGGAYDANSSEDWYATNLDVATVQRIRLRGAAADGALDASERCDLAHSLTALNSQILLENNAGNRALVREWLRVFLEQPAVFCSSHPQDQAVWSLLLHRQALPLVFPTCWRQNGRLQSHGSDQHVRALPRFLEILASRQFAFVQHERTGGASGVAPTFPRNSAYARVCGHRDAGAARGAGRRPHGQERDAPFCKRP